MHNDVKCIIIFQQTPIQDKTVYFNPIRHLSPRGHIYNTSIGEQCIQEYKNSTKVAVVCFQHLEKIALRTIFQKHTCKIFMERILSI